MKRRDFLKLSAALALTGAAAACGGPSASSAPAASGSSGASGAPAAPADSAAPASGAATDAASSAPAGGRVLVAYFSATGNTAAVAEMIAGAAGAELFALEPVTPYTDADLDYNDSGSRTSQERADPALQEVPLVSAAVDGWDTYDTVFVGYPIWWGGERLAELAGSGDWAEGRRFSAGASAEEIAAWLAELGLQLL